MNALEPLNFDANSLKDADKIIPSSLLDSLKSFTTHEHRYDALRAIIYGKLNHLSRPILQDSAEWRNMSLEAKCQVISEIQECFYDLQLVEQAGKKRLLSLARATFSVNKRRCAAKAPPVKSKPIKKQKLDAALRRRERDVKSPSVSTRHTASEEASNNHNDERNSTCNDTTSTRRRGGSNRDRAANHASISRSRQDCAQNSKNNETGRQDRATSSNDNSGEGGKPDDSGGVGNSADRTASPMLDSAPPKRRAAALAAAVSVAETVNPHRGNSPRKRTAGASSQTDDDASGDGSGTSAVTEEPTYCICEQISFGDMICCDYSKCPIEWFHFACVNIKLKPKGKKWFCPLCRGDKPTVLKSSLQSSRR